MATPHGVHISPRTRSGKVVVRSSTVTDTPPRASMLARPEPAIPPLITTTSACEGVMAHLLTVRIVRRRRPGRSQSGHDRIPRGARRGLEPGLGGGGPSRRHGVR